MLSLMCGCLSICIHNFYTSGGNVATYDQSGNNVETSEAINFYNSLPMKILIQHHKLESTYHDVFINFMLPRWHHSLIKYFEAEWWHNSIQSSWADRHIRWFQSTDASELQAAPNMPVDLMNLMWRSAWGFTVIALRLQVKTQTYIN